MTRIKNKIAVASPGRINLIGEHIDYNDGYVLPAAIDKHIIMSFSTNGSKSRCTIKSIGFDSVLVADLNQLEAGTEGWHNYVLGVLHEVKKRTGKIKGFDCEMTTNVPVGSGVSSSAALECGLAYGLNELFDLGLTKWDIIKIGQQAEHSFVGTQCGIMDQFASVMGKENHVMLLDCQSLDFKYIKANFDSYELLLLNTNVTHNLSTGEYNVRRQQCQDALSVIKKSFPSVESYRDVTLEMLAETKAYLSPVMYNRSSYVVQETHRVLNSVEALEAGDLIKFGSYMYLTHEGLKKKYEVSCAELDFLVDKAKEEPRILGSRMMGGGFGGCTLNLIHKDSVEDFIKKASKAYKEEFGIELTFFEAVPSTGTSIIN